MSGQYQYIQHSKPGRPDVPSRKISAPAGPSSTYVKGFETKVRNRTQSEHVSKQIQEIIIAGAEVATGDTAHVVDKATTELQTGVVVTLFMPKKKSETLTLCLRTELDDLVCVSRQGAKPTLTIDLCQIKEIVPDPRSRLARISEDVLKPELCITIFYGTAFMLQYVTIAAKDAKDYRCILKALETVMEKVNQDDPYLHKLRWLSREFNKIQMMHRGFLTHKEDNRVEIKKIQTWFDQLTQQITRAYLSVTRVKLKLPEKLDVNSFCTLVNEIMMPNPVIERLLREFGQSAPDGKRFLQLAGFEKFLQRKQNEQDKTTDAIQKMLSCLPLSRRSQTESPCFSANEFEDYLFSSINSILDPVESTVHQDMDQPLCNYWIASSHNTYLTGDQWKGDSNVETYTRCLQMGCRCVELDCWDGPGPDQKPVITHGKSLTSKIRAIDVLHTIKEHAWTVTDYPLILSIENHCSLHQQRLLASMFKEIFQDELLTAQVDPNETRLPSPNQLKRKIIIKNKKLQRDWRASDGKQYVDLNDLADAKKQGTLFMKYATEKKWNEVDVALTDTHFCFTPHMPDTLQEEQASENDHEDYFQNCDMDDDEEDSEEARPLSSQLWYHGDISRKKAEALLEEERWHGNGTFLVRNSGQGGFALSFIVDGGIAHSMIMHCEDEQGHTSYLLGNETWHDSVPDLVDYYYTHKLTYRVKGISVSLTYPVKRELGFEDEEWYRWPDINRACAEEFLKSIPVDGVFLVRLSSVENCFSLTMRYRRRISHYQIEFRRNKFVLGSFRFPTMNKLIEYFKTHALYKTAKLTLPASDKLQEEGSEKDIYCTPETYCDIQQEVKLVIVRALYDFHASSEDELSFKRGSYITNVVVVDEPWWRGDHAGNTNKRFPANYVEIVDDKVQDEDDAAASETLLRLSDCHFDDATQSRENMHFFNLSHPTQPSNIQIGSKKISETEEWLRLALECRMKIGEENLEIQRQERMKNIAQELSDLVIYCQAVPFNPYRAGKFCETSSFSEERIGRDDKQIIQYNQFQISRVYPKFLRVTSTNFDPIPKWSVGCQMVALNYQTPDKPMQINQAMFAQNGRCGYVLKPSFMNSPNYNPSDVVSLKGDVEAVVLTVTLLGGRNLSSMGPGIGDMQPFVVVEVLGLPLDCQRERTRISTDKNILNPVWKNEVFVFHISCPDLAFVRFEVGSEVNETSCLSQATFPVRSIRQGYRSVQLQNINSEPLAMSSLLVHIDIKNPKEEEEKNLFLLVEETRKLYMELSTSDQDEKKREQLQQTEQKLLEYLNRSRLNGRNNTGLYFNG